MLVAEDPLCGALVTTPIGTKKSHLRGWLSSVNGNVCYLFNLLVVFTFCPLGACRRIF